MNVVPNLPTAPSIPLLKDHMACVLADALDKHLGPSAIRDSDDYKLWYNLVRYNVLDTVNFTLLVTQTQGLNPSLNFISPLTNLGGPINKVIESSDGTNTVSNATANTFNFTLSVGVQLSGTQDRNFALTYIVDLHRLYSATFQDADGAIAYVPGGLKFHCDAVKHQIASGGMPYGLKGDLAVEDTIASGLHALAMSDFSPPSVGTGAKGSQSVTAATVSQAAGATAFSSKVDFYLQWGVNGGPSWNLLKFKGPAAGGSGASGQLLSYSRQKQDALISTFAATCKTDEQLDLADPVHYLKPDRSLIPPPPKSTSDAFSVIAEEQPLPPGAPGYPHQFLFFLAIPQDANGQTYYAVSNALGTIAVNTLVPAGAPRFRNKNGTVSWSGFVTVNDENTSYSLRGAVMDAQAGMVLGYAYLGLVKHKDGTIDVTNFKISHNALDALFAEDGTGPANYWQSLPSCGISGPFLANGLGLLQQLPVDVSATLQQQR